MMAKISLSRNKLNSSSPTVTGVPPNAGNKTRCPIAILGFTTLPVASSIPPGPTARTVPSFNFGADFSGRKRPDAVFYELSSAPGLSIINSRPQLNRRLNRVESRGALIQRFDLRSLVSSAVSEFD